VEADSPALTAGLQGGDIIAAINDTPVTSVGEFHDLLALYNVKDTITVTVRRNVKDTYNDRKIKVILSKKAG
jgi:Trypsin-like serine proteases, typically periplasmic, contain C-terminal PDZ domain